MTITTSFAECRTDVHARVPDAARRTPATVRLRLLDGAAPGGQLSGAVRHVIESHAALTGAQRLSLATPSELPRLYTSAEADRLTRALLAVGAHVVVASGIGA